MHIKNTSPDPLSNALLRVREEGLYLSVGLLNEEVYDMAWGTLLECGVWVRPDSHWFEKRTSVEFIAQAVALESPHLAEQIQASAQEDYQIKIGWSKDSIHEWERQRTGALLGLSPKQSSENIAFSSGWSAGAGHPPGFGYLIYPFDRISRQTLELLKKTQEQVGFFSWEIEPEGIIEGEGGELLLKEGALFERVLDEKYKVMRDMDGGFMGRSEWQWQELIAQANWIDFECENRWLDRIHRMLEGLQIERKAIGLLHLDLHEHIYWGQDCALGIQEKRSAEAQQLRNVVWNQRDLSAVVPKAPAKAVRKAL